MRPSLETPLQSCHQRSTPLVRFFGGSPWPLRVDSKSFAQHSASSPIWHLLVSLCFLFLSSSPDVPVTKPPPFAAYSVHPPLQVTVELPQPGTLCSLSSYPEPTHSTSPRSQCSPPLELPTVSASADFDLKVLPHSFCLELIAV